MKKIIKREYSRISNKSMRIRKDLMIYSGIYKLIKSPEHRILAYHGIAPLLYPPMNFRHISPDVFEKHLIFLKKNTHIISVEDFFQMKFIPGKKNIAITLDDGYMNNYKYAAPLLEKYQIPATIYITGINQTNYRILWPDLHDLLAYQDIEYYDFDDIRFYKKGTFYKPLISDNDLNLGEYLKEKSFEEKMTIFDNSRAIQKIINNNQLEDYWRLMSDNEISQIAETGLITIGSHGFFHNNLGYINTEEAKLELINSKNYLENITNIEVTSVAYPDGSYSREVIDAAEEAGFLHQLAVKYLFEEDRNDNRILDRIGLNQYETLSMQKLTMLS